MYLFQSKREVLCKIVLRSIVILRTKCHPALTFNQNGNRHFLNILQIVPIKLATIFSKCMLRKPKNSPTRNFFREINPHFLKTNCFH